MSESVSEERVEKLEEKVEYLEEESVHPKAVEKVLRHAGLPSDQVDELMATISEVDQNLKGNDDE